MPKETNKKQGKENKEKKHFWKDFRAELKKVIWPTQKQLVNSTVAVITIVLITGLIVFTLDFAFEKMNEYGIEKLKTVVETKRTVENTDSEDSVENNATDNNTQINQTSENSEAK